MVIVLLQRNNRVDNIPLINNILLEKQWSKLHQTAGTGKALVACVCVCRFYFTFAFGTATSPASCNTDYCIKLVTIKDLLNLGLNLLISNDKKKKQWMSYSYCSVQKLVIYCDIQLQILPRISSNDLRSSLGRWPSIFSHTKEIEQAHKSG